MEKICTAYFSLVLVLLLFNCSDQPTTIQESTDPLDTEFSGGVNGILKDDGKLVPNKGYSGFIINLLKNGTLINSDTTGAEGTFMFSNLEHGEYELSCISDFGYENIAYAADFIRVGRLSIEKDLLLESLKYDFSPIRVGYNYTFVARRICSGIFETDTLLSQIEITITGSQSIGDTLFYYFTGDQNYSVMSECYAIPDSHYVLTGFLKDFNNQVRCIIIGDGS